MRWINRVSQFLLLMSVSFIAAAQDAKWNLPEPVTPVARDIYQIHNKFMLVIFVLFIVVLGIMIYSIIRHRKSKGYKPANFTGPTTRSQILWTLVPFAILLYIDFILMGIPAVHSIQLMEDTKQGADMVVKITGSQWRWQYEYLDGEAQGIKFVSNLATPQEQIYNQQEKGENYLLEVDNHFVVPVNKKVRILITSNDVIHTWWVPAFGSARDAIPGFLRETWIQVEKPGTYRGQCKELCGKGHGFMPIVVDALPEDEFQAWVVARKEEMAAASAGAEKEWTMEELVAHGKQVYEKNCAVCHMANGQGMPPAFPPLTGSAIVAGPLFDQDGKLLADSHLDRVWNGKNIMPAWKDTLNDIDIAAVVTYERNALGNAVGDMLQPSQVRALR
ncbi:MAG TPA: cytochrome c oxidase subunit II [Methylophilaceae bacterium]